MKIRRRVQIIGVALTASTSAQATSSETAGETAGSEDDATS